MKTKRVIFSTYSSIYSSIVLEKLLVDKSIEVVAIINSTRIIHPKYGYIRGALKQLRVSGFRYSSYLFAITDLFRWLQPLSIFVNTKLKVRFYKSLHSLASENKIPLLDTLDINGKTALDFMKRNEADYLLAAHLNQLIKPVVLDFPNMNCINIHPSLLPSYKGVDPVFFALLNNEDEIGVTLHKMSEEFDTGEILSFYKTDITRPLNNTDSKNSLFKYNCQLFAEGAKLAIDWINNEKPINGQASNPKRVNYDSWPNRENIKKFKKAGNQLINFSDLRRS